MNIIRDYSCISEIDMDWIYQKEVEHSSESILFEHLIFVNDDKEFPIQLVIFPIPSDKSNKL